jgi:hypothetical protein
MEGADVQGVERLILEMARTFNWVCLYQAGHSSLSGRVERFHRDLVAQIVRESSGHLLLGIARDKVLYRDVFLGSGHSLVRNFTGKLFLQQVATLDFSEEVTPPELLAFFIGLRQVQTEKKGERLERLLKQEGVRGIGLYPYNYKEVLSRRIAGTAAEEPSPAREDELWRMLLTENVAAGSMDAEAPDDLSIPPEIMISILRKAQSAAGKAEDGAGTPQEGFRGPLPPELLQRVMTRLGGTFRRLPLDKRCDILQSVENGLDGGSVAEGESADAIGQAVVRCLTDSHTDDEFLELLAAVLSAERKGGQRLRKVFSVIASERNGDGSLLPKVRGRLGESLRTKNLIARKTWDAVEKLLLARSEDAYLGQDHSRLLEELSLEEIHLQGGVEGRSPADLAVTAEFEEANLRRKSVDVLLEILAQEENEGDFQELLEEIRKGIPNLISRREFGLLRSILSTATSLYCTAPDSRKSAIQSVIGELDFAHMLDLYFSPALSRDDKDRIEETIVSFAELSAEDFLDRLLMETDQSNRRALLSMAFRFGPKAIPAIRERLPDSHWYYVRNLCLILGEMGDAGVVPDLVRLLDHKDYRVRREAITALGKLRAVEAASFLGKILLHGSLLGSAKEEMLQIEAANALFRCGGTRGLSYLHRGVANCRPRVRDHCSALLRTMEAKR